MQGFEYVLLLLLAILLSNFINRFLPSISIPIIQIALGTGIALLPLNYEFSMDPGLFFVLFIAPLVFYASMTSDKKSLWEMKGTMMQMAFLLVFVTVIGGGFLVNLMIPALSLTGSFILVSALAPTDDIAVFSVAKRVNIPPKIMNILSGESIMNDASGIVCFQFALAAAMTGSFSVIKAGGQFLLVALGGALLGLLLTFIKFLFVRWLRSLGMENVTLHILIDVLTPFLIYMCAEALGVSGILAIFLAGIAHSFGRKRLNPETATLNIAANSIWSVLTFTLEGLVFIILGTQLPAIIKTVSNGSFPAAPQEILLYVLAITLLFVISRLVWSYVTIPQRIYKEEDYPIGKFRAALIFSLSGARGAVTLASAMSIPVIVGDGLFFPNRDLIILVATGVILLSLIITNFILPLLVEKDTADEKSADENEAYAEILQEVIRQLNDQATEDNNAATQLVIRSYYGRSINLQHKQGNTSSLMAEEQKLRDQIFQWEKECVLNLSAQRKIDDAVAEHYLNSLEHQMRRNQLRPKLAPVKSILKLFKNLSLQQKKNPQYEEQFSLINETAGAMVLSKLQELNPDGNDTLINKAISNRELILSIQRNRFRKLKEPAHIENAAGQIADITSLGFQFERDQIQRMFEEGRISWDTANELRNNIYLQEMQMK